MNTSKSNKLENFLSSFLFSVAVTISSLVFINSGQTYVLNDILKVSRDKVGDTAGSLVFYDQIISSICSLICGFLSDKINRKFFFIFGFIIMGIATLLYPFAKQIWFSDINHIFSSLLLYRIIFAIGGACSITMMTATIGDFSKTQSHGKISAYVGIASCIGAMISSMLLNQMPIILRKYLTNLSYNPLYSIYATFTIMSVILFGTAILVLKVFKSSADNNVSSEMKSPRQSNALNMKLVLAILCSFIARSQSISFTVFLPHIFDQVMFKSGRCKLNHENRLFCEESKKYSSIMTGLSNTFMLLCAPLFGRFSDRLGHIFSIILSTTCLCVSLSPLSILSNPESLLAKCLMPICGFGEIGIIISSMALLNRETSLQRRGLWSGIYSLAGGIGIIVTSKIGGIFFDYFQETSCLLITILGSLLVSLFSIFLGFKKVR